MNKAYTDYIHVSVTLIEIAVWNLPFAIILINQRLDLLDLSLGGSSIFQLGFYLLSKTSKPFRLLIVKDPSEEESFKSATTTPLTIVSIFFATILSLNIFGNGLGEMFR